MLKRRGRPTNRRQEASSINLVVKEYALWDRARGYAIRRNLEISRFVEICIHEFFVNLDAEENPDGK